LFDALTAAEIRDIRENETARRSIDYRNRRRVTANPEMWRHVKCHRITRVVITSAYFEVKPVPGFRAYVIDTSSNFSEALDVIKKVIEKVVTTMTFLKR